MSNSYDQFASVVADARPRKNPYAPSSVPGARGISGVIIALESPFDTSSVGQCPVNALVFVDSCRLARVPFGADSSTLRDFKGSMSPVR